MKYSGQRYPDDGPALARLSPEYARNLRVCLGDGALFQLEEQILLNSAWRGSPIMSEPEEKRRPDIEDIGNGTFDSDADIFLCSIAISLKRIAVAMAGNETNTGLTWLVAEYTNRRQS